MSATAQVNNRRVVRTQLRDLLRAALPGIQVEIGWPGDDAEMPSVWFGRMTGTKTAIALGAPRRIYNDEFTISAVVHGFAPDTETAEAQIDLQVNALEELLSTNTDLDATVGIADTGMAIDIAEFEPIPYQGGVILIAEVTIPFFSRIQ